MRQGSDELPVKPTDANCRDRFFFTPNGGILTRPGDADALATVDILNLKAERLRQSRELAIEAAQLLRPGYPNGRWQTYLNGPGAGLEFWPAILACVR